MNNTLSRRAIEQLDWGPQHLFWVDAHRKVFAMGAGTMHDYHLNDVGDVVQLDWPLHPSVLPLFEPVRVSYVEGATISRSKLFTGVEISSRGSFRVVLLAGIEYDLELKVHQPLFKFFPEAGTNASVTDLILCEL